MAPLPKIANLFLDGNNVTVRDSPKHCLAMRELILQVPFSQAGAW